MIRYFFQLLFVFCTYATNDSIFLKMNGRCELLNTGKYKVNTYNDGTKELTYPYKIADPTHKSVFFELFSNPSIAKDFTTSILTDIQIIEISKDPDYLYSANRPIIRYQGTRQTREKFILILSIDFSNSEHATNEIFKSTGSNLPIYAIIISDPATTTQTNSNCIEFYKTNLEGTRSSIQSLNKFILVSIALNSFCYDFSSSTNKIFIRGQQLQNKGLSWLKLLGSRYWNSSINSRYIVPSNTSIPDEAMNILSKAQYVNIQPSAEDYFPNEYYKLEQTLEKTSEQNLSNKEEILEFVNNSKVQIITNISTATSAINSLKNLLDPILNMSSSLSKAVNTLSQYTDAIVGNMETIKQQLIPLPNQDTPTEVEPILAALDLSNLSASNNDITIRNLLEDLEHSSNNIALVLQQQVKSFQERLELIPIISSNISAIPKRSDLLLMENNIKEIIEQQTSITETIFQGLSIEHLKTVNENLASLRGTTSEYIALVTSMYNTLGETENNILLNAVHELKNKYDVIIQRTEDLANCYHSINALNQRIYEIVHSIANKTNSSSSGSSNVDANLISNSILQNITQTIEQQIQANIRATFYELFDTQIVPYIERAQNETREYIHHTIEQLNSEVMINISNEINIMKDEIINKIS